MERRRFDRKETEAPLRLRLGESAQSIEAVGIDVSEGGLRCRVEEPVKTGDSIKVIVGFGNDAVTVTVTGTVQWTRPRSGKSIEIGVAFDTDDPARDTAVERLQDRSAHELSGRG